MLASIAAVVALAGCFSQPPAPSPDLTGDAAVSDGRGSDALADSPLAGHNIMFVSSGVFTSLPLTLGADASFCGTAAHGAGLPGNYIAWLSHPTYGNAADRLRAEPSARDWVRPDGKLFAATVDDIITGNIQNPPVIDENSHDVTIAEPTVSVATGTGANGMIDGSGAACGNGSIAIGKPGSSPAAGWTDSGQVNCSATNLRVYCFSFGG